MMKLREYPDRQRLSFWQTAHRKWVDLQSIKNNNNNNNNNNHNSLFVIIHMISNQKGEGEKRGEFTYSIQQFSLCHTGNHQ